MCTQRTPNNFSGELYERLGEQMERFIGSVLRSRLRQRSGIVMMSEILQFWWDSFWPYLVWTSRIFTYLDRYYVKLMHKEPLQIRAYSVFGRLVRAELGEHALRDGVHQLRVHAGHADGQSVRALEQLFGLEEVVPQVAAEATQPEDAGVREQQLLSVKDPTTDPVDTNSSSTDVWAVVANGADGTINAGGEQSGASAITASSSTRERPCENDKDTEALPLGLWKARWELLGLPAILADIRRFRRTLPFPEVLRRAEGALRRAEAAHAKLFKGPHQRENWNRIAAEAGMSLLRALEEQTDIQAAPGTPCRTPWAKTAERMPREVLHECVACLIPGCAP